MLEVYFEKESYPVSESVGQVETCLLLNCEAAEPVTVTLSAHENIPADAQGMGIKFRLCQINGTLSSL